MTYVEVTAIYIKSQKSLFNRNQIVPDFAVKGCGKRGSVRVMSMRIVMMVMMTLWIRVAFADVSVSDIQVFSGYPWKEVVVGYTITGTDAEANYIRLLATDKTANKSYTVETGAPSLTGAEFSEGRHMLRWNAASDGVKISSTNVVFTVSVVSYGGVQLWENGPYWSECNVGATKPEESGYYFWWGDTVGYKHVGSDWNAVDGSKNGFSFYPLNCPTCGQYIPGLKSQGYINTSGYLVASHDAATAHLGAPWRMPTDAEFDALIRNCSTSWIMTNGVPGRLVIGKGTFASKSIFLPAAGQGYESGLRYAGMYGFYWSSTPDSGDYSDAWYLLFGSVDDLVRRYNARYYGRPVRPIRGFAK